MTLATLAYALGQFGDLKLRFHENRWYLIAKVDNGGSWQEEWNGDDFDLETLCQRCIRHLVNRERSSS